MAQEKHPVVLTNDGINQINNLYKQVDELTAENSTLKMKLAEIEARAASLTTNVSELVDKLGRLTNSFEALSATRTDLTVSTEQIDEIAAKVSLTVVESLPKPETTKKPPSKRATKKAS